MANVKAVIVFSGGNQEEMRAVIKAAMRAAEKATLQGSRITITELS